MTDSGLRAGMATGIGSLPHGDAAAATAFVLEHTPDLPSAPQLSAARRAEGMLAQAAVGIPGVRVKRTGTLAVDRELFDPEAVIDTDLDGDGWLGTRHFLDAVSGRRRPIKLQMTGPLTLGMALIKGGASAAGAFRVASRVVAAQGQALVTLARQRAPRASLVVFVDEPALSGATDGRSPLSTTETVDLVSGALASLGPGVVSGLHCCGMTDGRLALQAGPAILSVPIDERLVDDGTALASFLEGGGWIAWGAVPTDRPIGDDPDVLWRRMADLWCELARAGCDPALLRRQAIITPACGLAGHGLTQAAWVFRLCRQIGQRVEDQSVASRLSIGA
jgi:methionine synthase II (cobalamin-independent)